MKEIAKTETTALANPIQSAGINPQDIVIPMVLIRQPTFKKDHMREFQPGDILKMPGSTPIVKFKDSIEYVPLAIKKQYRLVDITKASEPRGLGYEDWTAGAEWEFERDGRRIRRDQCYSAFIMFRDQLERQALAMEAIAKGEIIDPEDIALPTRIVFSRAAFQAGKVLNTFFELSRVARQTPAAVTWLLKAKEMKNDDGTWYIFDTDKAGPARKMTPKELLPAANMWVDLLMSSSVKTADVEEEIVEAAAPIPAEEQRF